MCSGLCRYCYKKRERVKYKETIKATQKAWYEKNKEAVKTRIRANSLKQKGNKEFQAKRSEYRLRTRSSNRIRTKIHYRNNKALYIQRAIARRAHEKQATPAWANLEKIREIYNNCPDGHEVDHIIPLKGANISGLHVETNLQYLTKEENRRKTNKYET